MLFNTSYGTMPIAACFVVYRVDEGVPQLVEGDFASFCISLRGTILLRHLLSFSMAARALLGLVRFGETESTSVRQFQPACL